MVDDAADDSQAALAATPGALSLPNGNTLHFLSKQDGDLDLWLIVESGEENSVSALLVLESMIGEEAHHHSLRKAQRPVRPGHGLVVVTQRRGAA